MRTTFLAPCVVAALVVARAPASASEPDRAQALARADELHLQIVRLWKARKFAEAEALAREALALEERWLGPEAAGVAPALIDLGAQLAGLHRWDEARSAYERALAIQEKALGRDHPDVVRSLHALAVLFEDQGAYATAYPLLERALAIREKELGPDHPQIAVVLTGLAERLRARGAYAEAQPLLERALAIREKAFGEDHPSVATSLNDLAVLLYERGAYAEAAAVLERSLAVEERRPGKDHAELASIVNNLGMARKAAGAYADARALFQRALDLRERALGKDHPDVAQSLNGLAELDLVQGAYGAARPLLERALAITERSPARDPTRTAVLLNNLGFLLAGQGAYAEAKPLFERALALREAALGGRHPEVAQALNNVGFVLHQLGDDAEALALYERALSIRERALGPDHPDVAESLGNLAALKLAAGDTAGARALLARGLALRERAFGADHPEVARSLHNLAAVLGAAEARPLYERAVGIHERAFGRDYPDLAPILLGLARALFELGGPAQARPALERALAITEAHVRRNLGALDARQRLGLVRSVRDRLDEWLRFAPRAGLSGLPEALRLSGLVARAEAADRAVGRGADGATRELATALEVATRQAARLANEVPASRDTAARATWQRRYAEAAAERERLALALSERSAGLRAALRRLDLGEADVQRSLRPDAALVHVLRATDRYLAWVVRPAGAADRVELGEAGPIDAACAAFATAITDDVGDEVSAAAVRRAGATLRELVWTPLEARLGPDVARVVICPDAALASVPFAALPGKEAGHALLDELSISYVFHPFDLVAPADAPPSGAGVLVVGGVDYDRADPLGADGTPAERPRALVSIDRAPRGGTFPPVPATRAEAEALRDRWGKDGTALLLGAQATEARFRAGVRGKRVVHVATHGFSRDDLFAGLYERRVKDVFLDADAERQLAVGHDPMLLSGLALAGANPRDGADGDDGVLTALEASYLDLDGVELVTLSACETAKGTAESGEGVLGLVSGFQLAGARRVLASLWKVDDEGTRRLMDGFYERLLRRDAPLAAADALRASALALRAWTDATGRAPFAAPRHWAAFVAYGR